ncbi:unnamed protein product [Paramecium pentaurelia]|uniref:Uncharacterized protein n=1 Tax=Paramecium pentaurelia TaxID=43138 RepID=A0A8S1UUQ5_9CILI|nr:unnamed protein product [Paramecium pentaurelia]
MISLSVFGMQRQDKKLNPLIINIKIFLPSLKYHYRIAHYYQMPDRTILRICQNPLLEARGTLILQGEFINQSGIDLKTLFKQKGSCFLEDLKQK